MQTTSYEVAAEVQATYPECIKESKSNNRAQALLWLVIAVVLYVIYHQQPDKESTLCLVQLALVALFTIMAVVRCFVGGSKLTYAPTGSLVTKRTSSYNIALQPDIMRCLEEGNTARLKALKSDDAGGLMVELLESEDHLFIAARLYRYEPHGYVAKTDWITMKR